VRCISSPLNHFPEAQEELRDTAVAQPALVTHGAMVLEILRRELGDIPMVCSLGHSVGEIGALHAAGSISLRGAVQLAVSAVIRFVT
jgi:malonyl CoA-acyl carrier protein transacylase